MFCPQCGVEYRAGFTVCADCHVSLVERAGEVGADAREGAPSDREPVILCYLSSPLDLALLRSLLDAEAIPCSVPESPVFFGHHAPVAVRVRRCDLFAARDLLASLRLPTEVSPTEPPAARGDEVSPSKE